MRSMIVFILWLQQGWTDSVCQNHNTDLIKPI